MSLLEFRPLLDLIEPLQTSAAHESKETEWGERIYSDIVTELVRRLYSTNFLIDFDWPSWQEIGFAMNEEEIARADLDTLRKLLTLYVRKERFGGGWIEQALERGIFVATLKRLQTLLVPRGD